MGDESMRKEEVGRRKGRAGRNGGKGGKRDLGRGEGEGRKDREERSEEGAVQ